MKEPIEKLLLAIKYRIIADDCYRQKRHSKAIEAYKKAIDNCANNLILSFLHLQLAHSYLALKKYQQAIKNYNWVIEHSQSRIHKKVAFKFLQQAKKNQVKIYNKIGYKWPRCFF